jgi:hypothetical protein
VMGKGAKAVVNRLQRRNHSIYRFRTDRRLRIILYIVYSRRNWAFFGVVVWSRLLLGTSDYDIFAMLQHICLPENLLPYLPLAT